MCSPRPPAMHAANAWRSLGHANSELEDRARKIDPITLTPHDGLSNFCLYAKLLDLRRKLSINPVNHQVRQSGRCKSELLQAQKVYVPAR